MKTLGIIPARYASTRFPGKPLIDIEGKSMIQRVYEQASKANLVDEVIVATDDERIFDHVKGFRGLVEMTDIKHRSGTDRCAEVAKRHQEFDFVINIQGDEPFIDPAQIDITITPLRDGSFEIATLAKPLKTSEDLFNPNIVKVVMAQRGKALYFSRHPIPFVRNIEESNWIKHRTFYKHIGLYAFKRKTLLELSQLSVSDLEKSESLEQLRWLENGYAIFVNKTDKESIGIDTPEDLEKAKAKLKNEAK